MRVYFTLGRSPVEANSVVVTVCILCIVGVSDVCPLKRKQARRERESELLLVNSL